MRMHIKLVGRDKWVCYLDRRELNAVQWPDEGQVRGDRSGTDGSCVPHYLFFLLKVQTNNLVTIT